jgi:hypothetical protein
VPAILDRHEIGRRAVLVVAPAVVEQRVEAEERAALVPRVLDVLRVRDEHSRTLALRQLGEQRVLVDLPLLEADEHDP